MSHLGDRIHDVADGEDRDAAAHVADCAECRAELEAIQRLKAELAGLPKVDLVPPAFGPIARRLAPRRIPIGWIAAVAAAVLAAFWLWPDPQPKPPYRPPPQAVAAGGDEGTIAALRAAYVARRSELRPETVELIEANLAIIERAVADARQALADDPNGQAALESTYQTEIEVLRQVAALPKEL